MRNTQSTSKTFDGYKRISFKYNEGWKNNDEHRYVGEFRILKIRSISNANADISSGDADGCIYTVSAPKGASKEDVINVLQNHFTWHCRCEHDCCGHILTGVYSIRRTKRKEWLVEVVRRYNV